MGEVKWMQEKKYGIMVHYLSNIQPREQKNFLNDWNSMVDYFDVKQFVDEIERMGAGWVIFPFGQNTGYYCSPNSVLEQMVPGSCSKRDLMYELGVELKKRGIRLIAYLPSEMDSNTEAFREKMGWDIDLEDKSIFQKRYECVIREWAVKMGSLLDGWWFDGCYNSYEKDFLRTQGWSNKRFNYEEWKEAACAGNPQAIIAMCPGAEAMKYAFSEQDYLAGEANTLNHVPEGPLIDGMQWHCLIWLDCKWGHWEQPGEICAPRFTDEEIRTFYNGCKEKRGAVTWNIGIYQDGKLAQKTVEQIVRLNEYCDKKD